MEADEASEIPAGWVWVESIADNDGEISNLCIHGHPPYTPYEAIEDALRSVSHLPSMWDEEHKQIE
jgi:hypothetical protein